MPEKWLKCIKNIFPMIDLSVIIPIYNTGTYLNNCLNSIMELSFKDYECIMVDDGSDAFTASIVDRFANIDKRFIAIHKINSGVSDTRNVGLSMATGDWIVFVDSDDTVSKHHLSIFENKKLINRKSKFTPSPIKIKISILPEKEADEKLLIIAHGRVIFIITRESA